MSKSPKVKPSKPAKGARAAPKDRPIGRPVEAQGPAPKHATRAMTTRPR
jgi:hypothetical protein